MNVTSGKACLCIVSVSVESDILTPCQVEAVNVNLLTTCFHCALLELLTSGTIEIKQEFTAIYDRKLYEKYMSNGNKETCLQNCMYLYLQDLYKLLVCFSYVFY